MENKRVMLRSEKDLPPVGSKCDVMFLDCRKKAGLVFEKFEYSLKHLEPEVIDPYDDVPVGSEIKYSFNEYLDGKIINQHFVWTEDVFMSTVMSYSSASVRE